MELILTDAKLITENDILENYFLRLKDGIIAEIGPQQDLETEEEDLKTINLGGRYLAPGFIDLHTHGAQDADTMDADPKSLSAIANYKLKQGTTGFLATTLTADKNTLLNVCRQIADYLNSKANVGNLLGVHLEGPHINEAKKGAQNPAHIRQFTVNELKELQAILQDKLKLITLAPEKEGAAEIIKYAVQNNIVAAAAHTNATWKETKQALNRGISHASHFFNGMKGLHHRNPGPVGAFLESNTASVELIADGHHLHPAVINLVLKTKEEEKVILVTDSMRAAGMEDGEYDLGGLKVTIKQGVARLESGNLAGSTATMNQILKNIMEMTNLDLVTAVKLMTANPARKLRIDDKVGSILPGKQGNLIVLDSDLEVKMTILEGEIMYDQLR